MQLKGLVRFFTIVLIIVSLYVLSFTWFVRNHEKKLEALATSYVNVNYPDAKGEERDSLFNARLTRLKDSTKDVTITYGLRGAMSYQEAKEEELNLGLDLQGGMNVTLEVEMTGLLKTLSNGSTDPNFLQALENANRRKANSDANFIQLFAEEYKKIAPDGNLASIFAAGTSQIKIGDSDREVINVLEGLALDAFDNTYRIMRTRIDQFGVAQPNINPDRDRGIITVELPGIQDKERVRKFLQSSANLQFWEVYNFDELQESIVKADAVFFKMMGGKSETDTTGQSTDTTAATATTTQNNADDTSSQTQAEGGLKTLGAPSTDETPTGDTATQNLATDEQDATKHLGNYIYFIPPNYEDKYPNGDIRYPAAIAMVPVKDTSLVRGYLETPSIRSSFPSQLVWMYGIPTRNANNKQSDQVPLYAIKPFRNDKARIEGDAVQTARADFNPGGQPEVTMQMTPQGADEWGKMTKDNEHKPVAIALDNIIYSAPHVTEAITTGNSSISGGFTVQEAQDLARILNGGKYPAPAKIVQEQQVGATLGSDAIQKGMMAFGISFIVIFLLMLVYYNTSGWVANIALILNLLFTVGVLTALGATLTAPGIAGLVLTIGMAVDTNVIIYERIKEELTRGKGYIPAINEGYKRSLPPVLDAHITTLLTAIILFYFGLGPVKGFATTQILGIILSLFCGILVSRWITEWFTNKQKHLKYFTGISRRVFKHASFKFIQYRKVAYGISVLVLLAGVGAFFNGFDQGVEFKGGRSYTVGFSSTAPVEEIRASLTKTFNESPVIKTVGNNSTLDITTAYLIDSTGQDVDSIVENTLMGGLKNYGATGILGSKKVLPTVSDDLKTGAIQAIIFAIVIIFLYIFIRFRDWRYSMGTIVALLHDVLIALAVFSFAKSVVPFPLEIDQHFIAAILTVVGFSMNDTVIVFDRIREYSREMRGATKTEIINSAINDTLSRTIMTSLTVFLTILILFLVGGEVTKGFAFAMLIGVITGTYSSIFVAAPILIDIAKKKPLGKAEVTEESTASAATTAKPVNV